MGILDNYWTQPLNSLLSQDRLSGNDIGCDSLGAYLECSGGDPDVSPAAGYIDYLQFATERDDIPAKYLSDGWLNADGRAAVSKTIARILAAETAIPQEIINSLDVSDSSGGDDPHIDVSLGVPFVSTMTVEQAHDKILWPFWATMINITDPGTFGRPYLWNEI